MKPKPGLRGKVDTSIHILAVQARRAAAVVVFSAVASGLGADSDVGRSAPVGRQMAAAPSAPRADERAVTRGALAVTPQPPSTDARQAALGRLLFFDDRLSGDGSTSCATCHDPDRAFAGEDALSPGYRGTLYFRNAPSVMNAVHRRFLYWDGRMAGADLPTLVRDHVSEHHFMAADGRLVIERLRQIPAYADRFREAFGSDVSYGRILNAVAAYVRTLNSRGSPLDRHLAGDRSALSPSAAHGFDLFQERARCTECHSGPLLSDERFHRTGVPENRNVFADPERHITFRRFMRTLGVDNARNLREDVGRYAVTKKAADRGRFLTPSLRDVARTAPYMHNGVFSTLEEVVSFYDRGGGRGADRLRPLGLSPGERLDLIAFLREGLSGQLPDQSRPETPAYGVLRLPRSSAPAGGVR